MDSKTIFKSQHIELSVAASGIIKIHSRNILLLDLSPDDAAYLARFLLKAVAYVSEQITASVEGASDDLDHLELDTKALKHTTDRFRDVE
jgi:hypothetical protein